MPSLFKRHKGKQQSQPDHDEQLDDDVPAYGWDAITAKFDSIYPGQDNPLHYGTIVSYKFGGPDPLQGISVYDGGEYWHFVTYGFSDLYDKESDGPEWSGYGFELTLKLKKLPSIPDPKKDDSEIKNIVGVLQSLARYVFGSGNCLNPYEHIYTGQTDGFDAKQKSKLTGFGTLPDEAGTIETPNGKVQFVCVVGLTAKELESIKGKEYTTREILELLGSDLTDYSRSDVV